ncbi:MAG: hypothetical protein L3K17_01385, partial [Thermoplasmata archaeon]|nr:hypothetical protein [Thermoplasmata archaeon]
MRDRFGRFRSHRSCGRIARFGLLALAACLLLGPLPPSWGPYHGPGAPAASVAVQIAASGLPSLRSSPPSGAGPIPGNWTRLVNSTLSPPSREGGAMVYDPP